MTPADLDYACENCPDEETTGGCDGKGNLLCDGCGARIGSCYGCEACCIASDGEDGP